MRFVIAMSLLLSCVYSSVIKAENNIITSFSLHSYQGELLKLALSYTPEKNYNLSTFGVTIPTIRAYNLLKENGQLDIISGTSTIARESTHLPIKFPIFKGVNGWRVSIINQDNPDILKSIKSSRDLDKLIAGQFHMWTDTAILESNNLHLYKSGNFDGLFQMIDKKRLDYFPQSVLEVVQNVAMRPELKLTVDTHILIKYPTAVYFYVNQNDTELAKDIRTGLELALMDGNFSKLFDKHYKEVLAKLKLQNRKVIKLKNPFLVEGTPLNRRELWYSIKE